VIVGLAFLITFINYIDRSAISYAILPIKKEFGLDNTAFGMISGTFGIGYAAVAIISGVLVDRIGARAMWSGAAILWSLITGMFSLTNGFWSLLICRTALGAAEGPNFPSLTRICADWLPVQERGRATALGLTAVPASCVIAAPLISNLIISYGWRMMFLILAFAGIIWAAFWIMLFRNRPSDSKYVSKEELTHINSNAVVEHTLGTALPSSSAPVSTSTWKSLLTNPSLMSNNFAFSAFGYLLFFSVYWLPDYLEEVHGLQLREIGLYLTLPWLTAAILLPLGGWISDTIWIKTHSLRLSRSYLIVVCQLLSAVAFVPLLFWHSLPVALTCLCLGLGIGLMPNAAFYIINSDLAKSRAATSLGIMNVFAAISSISAPLITGKFTSMSGSYNSAFLLIIIYSVISAVVVLLFQNTGEQREAKHYVQ
jgi:MFS transporter, ACS family, hexuronate transporter